jgi:hypothetical protein
MNSQEIKYTRGFNNGYVLAKYEPGLLSKIIKNLRPVNDYLEGFFSGKDLYELELIQGQLKNLDNIRIRMEDRNIDLERG